MKIDDVKSRIEKCRDCTLLTPKRDMKNGPYTIIDNENAKILVIGPIVNTFDAVAMARTFERFGDCFFGDNWHIDGMYDFTSAIRCNGVRYVDAINNCWVHTKNICVAKNYLGFVSIGRFAREQLDPSAEYYTIERTLSGKPILFLPVPATEVIGRNKKGADLVDSLVAEVNASKLL